MRYIRFPEKTSFIYFISGFIIISAFAHILRRGADGLFESLYYRVYYFENSFDFILGILAAVSFFTARVAGCGISLKKIRPAECRSLLYGISFSFLLFFLSGLEIKRPEHIVWTDILHEDPSTLAKAVNEKAAKEKKPVLYYFHADWCDTCDDFERYILSNPTIKPLTDEFIRVKVDVSDFEKWHEFMDENFLLHGVPSLGIREKNGRPVRDPQLMGEHISLLLLSGALREAFR